MRVQNHPCQRGRTILRLAFERKPAEPGVAARPARTTDREPPHVLPAAVRRGEKPDAPVWSTVA